MREGEISGLFQSMLQATSYSAVNAQAYLVLNPFDGLFFLIR